jgi:hypothetical protein
MYFMSCGWSFLDQSLVVVRHGWVMAVTVDQFFFCGLQATRSGDDQRHEAGLARLFGQQGWVQGK